MVKDIRVVLLLLACGDGELAETALEGAELGDVASVLLNVIGSMK